MAIFIKRNWSVVAVFALFVLSYLFLAEAMFGGSKNVQQKTAIYDRAVNETLDVVMWVEDQHQGKMTWEQLNAEVCRHMHVKRTQPWERK
jgi:hypothetical protein